MIRSGANDKAFKNQRLSSRCYINEKFLDFFLSHLDKCIFVNKCGWTRAGALVFYLRSWFVSLPLVTSAEQAHLRLQGERRV